MSKPDLGEVFRRVRQVDVTEMGGTLWNWYQCPFCEATLDEDYRSEGVEMSDLPHAADCLWVSCEPAND